MRHTSILTAAFSIFFFASCGSKPTQAGNTDSTKKEMQAAQQIIKVGKGPDAMFLVSDAKLYIANVEDTFISVIDIESEKEVDKIEGIKYPWGFAQTWRSNLVAVSGYEKQVALINSVWTGTLNHLTMSK